MSDNTLNLMAIIPLDELDLHSHHSFGLKFIVSTEVLLNFGTPKLVKRPLP